MPEQSDFNNSIRQEEDDALHEELVNRLHQHGVLAYEGESSGPLADLLTAIDQFESAVEEAGGDLFVDAPDSSEPERPEFVLPHIHDAETIKNYTHRVRQATERLRTRPA